MCRCKPLRLLIVAHDNEGSVEIVKTLLRAFPDQVVGVCITTGIYYRRTLTASLIKLLRESSFKFAANRLIDFVLYRIKGGVTLKSLCKRHKISFFTSRDVNDEESITRIMGMKPNMVMSAFTMHIVGQELIDLPDMGTFGIHPSLIPDYRGLEVFFWMLANDETESGSTAFLLTTDIDKGKIICVDKWSIESRDSVISTYQKLTRSCADLAVQAVEILMGSKDLSQTDTIGSPISGSYFPMPTRKSYRDFRKLGRRWR